MGTSTKTCRTLISVGLCALLSLGLLGAPAAEAEVRGNTAHSDGNRGYFAPANRLQGFTLTPECVDTNFGPRVRVKVRSIMWAQGGSINGFHFKVRLVPAGTDGQLQLAYAWSDNFVRSFSPTPSRVQKGMVGWAPSQDATAEWEIEVKLKYTRALGRPAYRAKFRIPFNAPDCGGGISPS